MLEDTPERAGVGEGRGDLVGQVSLRCQTEIGRALAGQLTREELVEQVRPEQSPFDSNRRIKRHGQTTGCSTRIPSRSGGNCGARESPRTPSATALRTRLWLFSSSLARSSIWRRTACSSVGQRSSCGVDQLSFLGHRYVGVGPRLGKQPQGLVV